MAWITVPGWAEEYRILGTATGFMRGYPGTPPLFDPDGNCIPGTGLAGASGETVTELLFSFGDGVNPQPQIRIEDSGGGVPGESGFYFFVRDGWGGMDSAFVTEPFNVPRNETHTFEAEWSVTFSEVELEFEQQTLDSGFLGPNGFLSYFGTENQDGLLGQRVAYRRVARSGETVTVECTLTMDGGTPVTITSTHTLTADYGIPDYLVEAFLYGRSTNYIGTTSLAITEHLDLQWDGPDWSYTHSGGGSNQTAYEITGTTSVYHEIVTGTGTVQTDACATNLPVGEGSIFNELRPVKRHRFLPKVILPDGGFYSDALKAVWISHASGGLEQESEVTLTSGEGSETKIQYSILASYQVGASTPVTIKSVQNWASPRCWLKRSDLTANGDDARDWRLCFAGVPFKPFRLKWESPVELDDFSTGWTGTDPITKTYGSMQYAEGFRYLRVSSTGSGTLTLTFTNSITTETRVYRCAVGANQIIDLCAPVGEKDKVDEVESRFPLKSATEPTEFPGAYQGLCAYETISIETGGAVPTLLEAVLDDTSAYASWVTEYGYGRLAWDSPTDNTYVQCGVLLNSDGRTTESASNYKVDPIAAGSDTWTFYSLNDLAGFIEARRGWQKDILSTFPDTFHTDSAFGHYCWGGGLLWRGGWGGSWFTAVDLAYSSTWVDVYAQALWDQVDCPPRVGDVWEGTNFPTSGSSDEQKTVPLRAGKVLRGRAWGLVLKRGQPFPTATTVELRTDPADVLRGDGTTDTLGFYKTGDDFGQGNTDHKVKWPAKNYETVQFKVKNRFWHRRCFHKATAAHLLAYAVRHDFIHFRAFADGGTTDVERFDNARNLLGTLPTVTAEEVCLAALPQGVLLGAIDAGIYKVYESTGGSWTLSYSLGTGAANPVVAVAPDGNRYHYWLEGTTVKGARVDGDGNTLETFTPSGLGTIDEDGLAGATTAGEDATLVVLLTTIEGGAAVTRAATDGMAFS